MKKSNLGFAAGLLTLASTLSATPASAVYMTFVSGKGTDAGTCASPATPCRTFSYALGQTGATGEIKALDPADYRPVVINKSVTITGVPGASIARGNAGTVVDINAPNADIKLQGIAIDGFGLATNGILVSNARSIAIIDCSVRKIAADGISISPAAGATSATISHTISSNNGNFGMQFVPAFGATVKVSIDHSTTNENGFSGILVSNGATVTIVESFANRNASDGFRASGDSNAKMRIGRSVATGNSTGVNNVSGIAAIETYGDNEIDGNTTNVSGAFALVNRR